MPSEVRSELAVPGAAFDVRAFARSAAGSHREFLDLESYRQQPLSEGALDLVDYLSRLERSTLRYLRHVLVSPTHEDSRVTAFLTAWAYEKFWIADALEAVVAAHAYRPAGANTMSLGHVLSDLADRLAPAWEAVVTNLVGEDVIAVHMTAAAIDEILMQAAYERLSERTGNPALRGTLDRLLTVKRRHGQFFEMQARDRLAGSPRAVRITRWRVDHTRWPLGSGDEPVAAAGWFFRALFDRDCVLALDGAVDDYPGLFGLHPLSRSAAKALRAIA